MTKVFSLVLALSFCASAAMAETCHSRATDKNLHGAALTSFMKKCVRETGGTCSAMAADKSCTAPPRQASRINVFAITSVTKSRRHSGAVHRRDLCCAKIIFPRRGGLTRSS